MPYATKVSWFFSNVLDDQFVADTRERMYAISRQVLNSVDEGRLAATREMGVLRLMMKFDLHFARFLEIPELLHVLDAMVSPTAVLHTQNGFILPSHPKPETTPKVFQNTFHMDFPRYMNGYIASVCALFMISGFYDRNRRYLRRTWKPSKGGHARRRRTGSRRGRGGRPSRVDDRV